MQKPGKRARYVGLVDMSQTPEKFVYERPPNAEKVIDYPIVVDPDGILDLYVVAWEYRSKIVDFAFTLRTNEIPDASGGEDHVARIDCCHSRVHVHQFYKDGAHFKTGEPEENTTLVEIDKLETAWEAVDSAYDDCLDTMTGECHRYYERWRSNGRNV